MITNVLKERYCFEFCKLNYVFRNKKLYRQPYFDSVRKRAYKEREIKRFLNGYYLGKLYVSDNIIKSMLQLKTVNEQKLSECPF